MTQLKHEIAASTSRFRQGYQDEAVFLSTVLEGNRQRTRDRIFLLEVVRQEGFCGVGGLMQVAASKICVRLHRMNASPPNLVSDGLHKPVELPMPLEARKVAAKLPCTAAVSETSAW